MNNKVTKHAYLQQFDNVKLNKSTRLIVIALASFAACKEIFAKQDEILSRAGVADKRTFRNVISFLVENQYLEVKKRRNETLYVLLLRDAALELPSQIKKRQCAIMHIHNCSEKQPKSHKKDEKNKKAMCSNVHSKCAVMYTANVQYCISNVQDCTFYYIDNHNSNLNYNLNFNHKRARENRTPLSVGFSAIESEKSVNQTKSQKIEALKLNLENTQNALEALQRDFKVMNESMYQLLAESAATAIKSASNDVFDNNVNDVITLINEKQQILDKKAAKKSTALVLQKSNDDMHAQIELFHFSDNHIQACKKRMYNTAQISAALDAFKSMMHVRQETKNKVKCLNKAASTYINAGYLDKSTYVFSERLFSPKNNSSGANSIYSNAADAFSKMQENNIIDEQKNNRDALLLEDLSSILD